MEYLQYYGGRGISMNFKNKVLNLVINGIPSIQTEQDTETKTDTKF